MDIATISTIIVSSCAGLAALTPLIKAISHWHINVKKMSKTETTRTTRQSQTSTESQQDERPWWRRPGLLGWFEIIVSLFMLFVCLGGLYMLQGLMLLNEPLTTGRMAQIGAACVFVLIGLGGMRNRKV